MEKPTMATDKTTNSASISTEESLNMNLSKSVQKELDEVSVGDGPGCRWVSWVDLYAIFQNSRQVVRESKQLAAHFADDGDLKAMAEVMQENHVELRGALFLILIEKLLKLRRINLRRINAYAVLWTYGEELELVDMIARHLARGEEETAQFRARLEAVCA
jgi:hypothetical protein